MSNSRLRWIPECSEELRSVLASTPLIDSDYISLVCYQRWNETHANIASIYLSLSPILLTYSYTHLGRYCFKIKRTSEEGYIPCYEEGAYGRKPYVCKFFYCMYRCVFELAKIIRASLKLFLKSIHV